VTPKLTTEWQLSFLVTPTLVENYADPRQQPSTKLRIGFPDYVLPFFSFYVVNEKYGKLKTFFWLLTQESYLGRGEDVALCWVGRLTCPLTLSTGIGQHSVVHSLLKLNSWPSRHAFKRKCWCSEMISIPRWSLNVCEYVIPLYRSYRNSYWFHYLMNMSKPTDWDNLLRLTLKEIV
jgi:hypothetical protein